MKERLAPAIHVPPPLIIAAGFLFGYGLDTLLPLSLYPQSLSSVVDVLGVVLVLLGASVSLWGLFTFIRARTGVLPIQSVNQFVTHGPYRFSRNPMYTGMAIIYLGGTLLLNSVWPIPLLPLTLWALWMLVVRKEEGFLAQKYGATYEDYRDSVRRWI